MRARTVIDLLSLSTNLYMIMKDKEFMEQFSEMAGKGKEKLGEFASDFTEFAEGGESKFMEKVMEKAKQAKEELEKKMEEIAVNVYGKMHIAHINDVNKLQDEIDLLKARLIELEHKTTQKV